MNALSLTVTPLLPAPLLWGAALAAFLLLGLSALYYRRGLIPRAVCALAFIMLFVPPSLVTEERSPVKDVAVIAVDRSPSQNFGQRPERTAKAFEKLKAQLDTLPDLETRVIESPAPVTATPRETRLFDQITQTLADVPPSRRAGLILITDGQIHDVPAPDDHNEFGPVHTLLSGEKNEKDRQIVLLEAPSYGIVGQTLTLRYRIEDTNTSAQDARITIRQGNEPPRISFVPVNTELTARFIINHAGQNIIDMDVEGYPQELTKANNRIPIIVNGVRDRLKVLLVSGQPHAGGRAWRNFLSADPGVDLVHFTILREPHKLDATPQNELSLIAFPFQELFETKLYDFDLIIFDRYRLNRILPSYYFRNIARYVENGGALLEASGPSYAGEDSIFNTDLNEVLPAVPTGEIFEQPYMPVITQKGRRHPVTQDLAPALENPAPSWGHWLRQIGIHPVNNTDILMSGYQDKPLLILNHVGKGRVAQLASDQIWLWARGFEGGGPQGLLLRRLAHWLMKEPDLEENALLAREQDGTIIIERRSLEKTPLETTVTAPDGSRQSVTLISGERGLLESRIPANQLGVYSIDDGSQERFVLSGGLTPPELKAVKTSAEKLKPHTERSGGGIYWLADTPAPHIRLIGDKQHYAGRGWLGLRQNNSYIVKGVTYKPLLPTWLYALLLTLILAASWGIEGRLRRT